LGNIQLGWLARGSCSAEENSSLLLSPCPPRFGKCVLLAKAAPAGHRRLALRKGIEPAIRRSLWISGAPGAIGICFVNKNREHTKQSRYSRDHAHARLLELKQSALIEFIMLSQPDLVIDVIRKAAAAVAAKQGQAA
jgi:hypothetical protein